MILRQLRRRLRPDAPRVAARIALLFLAVAVALALPYAAGFRVLGPSPSMPRGVYRVSSAKPAPGDVVLMCLPRTLAEYGREQRYLLPRSSGLACPGDAQPVGKLLAADVGDDVVVAEQGLYINGLRVVSWRGAGRRPRSAADLPARYRLGAGEVWLHAPHPRSWDSRHFGPVALPEGAVALNPIWTEDRTELAAIARLVRLAHSGAS